MYILLLITIILLLSWIMYIYNRLVKNRNHMQEAWSIIDVFLKKRYELVPVLVNTVKGYSLYEKRQLENIIRLRAEAIQATNTENKIKTENKFRKTADQLFLSIENYPELKADQHFLKLQRQLVELENDLEKARRYYNGTVRENNTYQENFPSNLIAGLFKFQKGVFFSTDESPNKVPDISIP